MKNLSDVGNLMYLYLDHIDPGAGTSSSDFLIHASAHLLSQTKGRNWVPLIVKEVAEDRYEAIGNTFIYAVAEVANLEKVWCIIADDSEETKTISRVLSGEEIPKANLSKASRDTIMQALQYLIEQPGSLLKSVNLAVATNRIDEAPRQYWKDLNEIVKLKCGITKGKKLDSLKQVFYLTPEPLPDIIKDPALLSSLTVPELRVMARKREISGAGKMKKAELINALSE
ncbi:MAG: Rho termination factor [Leptolyngbyaceae cyanobacterium SM2_5_2]|nr:Rho termination factor [Leptolyngbyaceae cyanobacterium SM2_5_2]